jgi:polysaccharide biosynthesis protein PslG
MKVNGDGDKPIWFTELGWSSHPNTGDEPNWDRGVTPQQQADYAIRAIQLVRSRYPYVTNMILYNERNRATGDVQLDNYGILHRDLSEKPVYTALRSYLSG